MTIKTKTLGCRLNHYESDILKQMAEAKGMKDIYIINTCAVTNEAERKSRQSVHKISRENPDKKILVTGCAAKLRPEQFNNIENVEVIEKNIPFDARPSPSVENRSKAFIEIQNGCYHACSYCTITIARGQSISIKPEYILNTVEELAARDIKEITFTGVNIVDYGLDLFGQYSLGSLVYKAAEICRKYGSRLRLSSLDPNIKDQKLINVLNTHSSVMPYLHFSLQSGSNKILKLMNRRHTREQTIDNINLFSREMTFSADIIVGFPGETEDDFQETYSLISEYFSIVHVFPFSSRPGTEASKMKDTVNMKEKKSRLKLLHLAAEQNRMKIFSNMMGQKITVLIEDNNIGYSDRYFMTRVENGQKGTLQSVLTTDFDRNYLIGHVL